MFLLIAAVMVSWFAQMHQRNRRSWQAILARMSPECRFASAASSRSLKRTWTKTPRTAFRDAGVLMEMADYAEHHSPSHDAERAQLIRTAALELRIASVRMMIRSISFR